MLLNTIKALTIVTVLSTVLVMTNCGGSSAAPGSPPPPPPPPPVTTVAITPPAATVQPGATLQFMAQVSGSSNQAVTWSVTAGSGSITSAGLYTAPATNGLFSIVATSSANTNSNATAIVLVTTSTASFVPTGSLQNGREFHTATLLADGKLLVAGGAYQKSYCQQAIGSAEIYDLVAGSFASTGSMTTERYGQTSTVLPNGNVLITGGFSPVSDCLDGPFPALSSAELFDPANGSFAPTGSMAEERGGHTATLLPNGKVLIAGGGNTGGSYPALAGSASGTAEVYDPASGTFSATGEMVTSRAGQTATLLANGTVLIAGGWTGSSAIASAELYDPATGSFTLTGNMSAARTEHTATELPDGRVLITGGLNVTNPSGSSTAEIYDPATASFVATGSMTVARALHTATLLPNGTVVVVGGGTLAAETYDPSIGSFSLTALTESYRSGHSATLLQNGSVVVVGGLDGLSTAELFP
jgi:hypothetical protein